jgi:hypothetical protein
MSNLLKNLLIALGLAVILFIGYTIFVKDDGSAVSTFSQEAELESQSLLATLGELESLDVEGRIFNDPLFLSLKDFRIDLGNEPSGRANPFAPLE